MRNTCCSGGPLCPTCRAASATRFIRSIAADLHRAGCSGGCKYGCAPRPVSSPTDGPLPAPPPHAAAQHETIPPPVNISARLRKPTTPLIVLPPAPDTQATWRASSAVTETIAPPVNVYAMIIAARGAR